MSGFIYNIGLNMLGGNSLTGTINSVNSLNNSVNRVNSSLGSGRTQLSNYGRAGKSAFDGIGNSAQGLIAQIGGVYAVMDTLRTTANMEGLEKAIVFTGAERGAANLEFVKKKSDEMGLSMKSSLESSKILSGSLIGSGIEGEFQNLFDGISKASMGMGLSSEATQRAITSIAQMASKGQVMSEELKGQFAEAIPGGINVMARALGVGNKELGKMMENGLDAKMALPLLAKELSKTFGPLADQMQNSATANFNRLSNSILQLKTVIGTELMPAVINLLQNAIIPGMKWLGQNTWVLYGLGLAFFSVAGAVIAMNLAFLASPIGWVIGGIVLLGAGLKYLWDNWKIGRQYMLAWWNTMKVIGSMLYSVLLAPLTVGAKLIAGMFTLDLDLIKEGLSNFKSIADQAYNLGKNIASGVNGGIDEGSKSWDKTIADKLNKAHPGANGLNGLVFGEMATGGSSNALQSIFKNKDKTPTKGLGEKSKAGIEGITSGGVRNITIQIGKFMDQLIIKSDTVEKGADQMADMIIAKITQAINSANQIQTTN